ncbi:MAG: GDP-mannose 4,6-dehydratase [Rhodovarius sp.]|nr:GDP-mannose 4,6-dehydratase [Rhodovarius sp.]MDW8314334.1 GDP-mannose 4,6-dehydratase [Rhodovarius sp.]
MAEAPHRILVTGAAGFVGRHLLTALRRTFPAARLIAGLHHRPAEGWDAALPIDLSDPAAVAAALATAEPDAVVHLGAQANVAASFRDPLGTFRANLDGSLHLAEAIRQRGPACRLLFVSTGEIYGLSFRRGVPLDEEAPLAPANPYAAAKAAADIALGEMALRGLSVLRVRPFNHVGPGQSEGFAVAAFARQVARIEAGLQPPVMQVGALDRWRDFLDVRDVAAAYALLLARWEALPNGAAVNIASGTARRIGDVLQALLDRAGLAVRIEESAAALRPTDVVSSLGDAGRIRAALGWAPTIPWEQTLDAVLADWRERIRQELEAGAAPPS